MSKETGSTDTPPWEAEMVEKFTGQIAHTFILQGAVEDYVAQDCRKLDDYLTNNVFTTRIAVFFDPSRGVSFTDPKDFKNFCAAAEIPVKEGRDWQSPLLPNPSEALPKLEQFLLHASYIGKVVLIIEYPELIWPGGSYGHLSSTDRINLATLRRWASSSKFVAAGQAILMLTSSAVDLHESLLATSSGIDTIEIPLPGVSEREAFISDRIDEGHAQLDESLTIREFAALTGGLSRVLIQDIILRAAITKSKLVTRSMIRERKDQIIKQEFGDLIEILEPRHGFDGVGGMTELKTYLQRSVVDPLHGRSPRSRMPSGVMLAGPPGTGKTFVVTALAKEAGVNVVKLNAGRLLGKYVGDSERNLERALSCIRALAPVIVMVDEIEQQFQRGGSSDNGVDRRIFGRLLEEMSGSSGTARGDVIWMAATNRVDEVDPALRRPGRFDRIVPILPPTTDELWDIILRKIPGVAGVNETQKNSILNAAKDYTGADIEGAMIKATELAFDDQSTQASGKHLLEALTLLQPSTTGEQVQLMTNSALSHCNDMSLIPSDWREKALELHAAKIDR